MENIRKQLCGFRSQSEVGSANNAPFMMYDDISLTFKATTHVRSSEKVYYYCQPNECQAKQKRHTSNKCTSKDKDRTKTHLWSRLDHSLDRKRQLYWYNTDSEKHHCGSSSAEKMMHNSCTCSQVHSNTCLTRNSNHSLAFWYGKDGIVLYKHKMRHKYRTCWLTTVQTAMFCINFDCQGRWNFVILPLI